VRPPTVDGGTGTLPRPSSCLLVPLALRALGCGDGVDPETFVPDDPDAPGAPLPTEDGPRQFALQEVLSILVPNPIAGQDPEHTVTTKWLLLDWERSGIDITWSETLCGLESTEVYNAVSSYPPGFIAAFPRTPRAGVLTEPVNGASFAAGPFAEVLGADLDDPFDDPLPEDPDDPAVVDSDGDGEPGVTVRVYHTSLDAEGDLYITQRGTISFQGVVVNNDRIEGYISYDPDQTILGATEIWLTLSSEPEPDPVQGHSSFVLQAVDDGYDCDQVLAEKQALFVQG